MDEHIKYQNVITAVCGSLWAIMPEKLEAILNFLSLKSEGVTISKAVIDDVVAARATGFGDVSGEIAVLPLLNTISNRVGLLGSSSGGTSCQTFGRRFDQAVADKAIGAIIIDVDSPGGSVHGVSELSQKIYDARSSKPIIAVVNSLCASAAFWIASAADEVVMTPSGDIGSVGVLAVHHDQSEALEKMGVKTTIIRAGKYKAEGNPYESLGDDAMAYFQGRVDETYTQFIDDLARNRGVSTRTVETKFGQGRVMGAQTAVQNHLADRIGTMEQVVRDLRKPSRKRRNTAALNIAKARQSDLAEASR